MIFIERKLKDSYNYRVEDVFGLIELDAKNKLNKDELDGIVIVIMRQNLAAQTIEGEVEAPGNVIKFKFVKTPAWSDDDQECENTPILTDAPASVFIRISQLMIRVINWPRKFAVAFRETWRKARE